MPTEGQTGVAIPVPEADPLLAAVAMRFPEAVRQGVPAHVSVLYPFLPAEKLDDRVISGLSELFAGQPAMSVTFGACHRSGEFVALRPEPIEGLEELVSDARRRWPEVLPYEGLYGGVEPHVTVALHTTEERAAVVESEIVPEWLPISAELREAWLLIFNGRWTVRQRFELGVG